MIANTPKTPYIAAVFTSIRTDVEEGENTLMLVMPVMLNS